ncbi:MAG: flavodoxin-dependent (E)-4-hydroxy-3-methylbut-2-enyl-diphosphate synthase [Candidatus Zixiibacteriota bacterium]|nr:MAG: flavodoxin-dependent (E)-4-hydroxy-3-methylbut-2-enyl-diphosphate synthase [candidate division Zixibacteria bacterium]
MRKKTERRKSRIVKIGNILIGGGHPIAVQTMVNTPPDQVERTISEINRAAACGAEIVRVAVPDKRAASALADIKKGTDVPLVADIHFNYRFALLAADAGFDKLRINPGNIGSEEKVRAVVDKAGEKGIPIRIGVNHGSVEVDLIDKHGGPRPEAMVESALRHVEILEKHDFKDIVISIKATSVIETIECYEMVAKRCDYPLHLGVTEAGTAFNGAIKSAMAMGKLLYDGIGDTIRVSLTADIEHEIKAAWAILKALGLRRKGLELVSCPSCGRTDTDVYGLAEKVEKALEGIDKDIKVAVMGCLVNGPGEAAEADIGVIGGKGRVMLTRRGEIVGRYDESEILKLLIDEINSFDSTG